MAEDLLNEVALWEAEIEEARLQQEKLTLAPYIKAENDKVLELQSQKWNAQMDLILKLLQDLKPHISDGKPQSPEKKEDCAEVQDMHNRLLQSDEVQLVIASQYADKVRTAALGEDYEKVIQVQEILAYISGKKEWIKKNKAHDACSRLLSRSTQYATGALEHYAKAGASDKADLSGKLLKLVCEL